MATFEWRPTGDHDPQRLAEARNQLVSVAQWLARVQQSFASAESGKDLSLRWSDERNVIATHDFADDVGVELQIDGLVLQFTESGQPSDHEIDVEERSPAHIEAWILIELLHRGLDRDRFSKALPYDTSALLNGDGVEFSPAEYQPELRALASLFRQAVSAVRSASAQDGAGSAIRISPRDLNVEAGAQGGAIGFSLGDAAIAEPFFYVKGAAGADEPAQAATAILRASELPAQGATETIAAFFASHGAPTRH